MILEESFVQFHLGFKHNIAEVIRFMKYMLSRDVFCCSCFLYEKEWCPYSPCVSSKKGKVMSTHIFFRYRFLQ